MKTKKISMIAKLKQDYLPEYPKLFPEAIVKKGEEFEVISFPPKVLRGRGDKPYFVYGKTSDGRSVRVSFSDTDLNYASAIKELEPII
mgnify:CR=1 FL=1